MEISYSVNPTVVDKPSEGWRSTRGWEFKESVDLFELIEDITIKGHPVNWCRFVGGYRHGDNIIDNSGGIGIDIDNDPGEPTLSLAEARVHPIYSTATICYPSPSFGLPGKGERYRLLWAMPEGIDPAEAKRLQRQLMAYTPGIDKVCQSAHNVWYGNSGGEAFWVNVDTPFPMDEHLARWQEWEAKQPAKSKSSTFVGSGDVGFYDPVIHGCFRNYEAEAIALLKKIPPRGFSGSGTYAAARDSLIVLLTKFGREKTREICKLANWFGQWDQEAVIDSLWEWLEDSSDVDEGLSWGTLIYHAKQG